MLSVYTTITTFVENFEELMAKMYVFFRSIYLKTRLNDFLIPAMLKTSQKLEEMQLIPKNKFNLLVMMATKICLF
jgi:hypothetical protein